jgi:hypothetical protein
VGAPRKRIFAVGIAAVVALCSGAGAAAEPRATAASVRWDDATAHPVRGGGALVRWTTRRETRNVGFRVYRAKKSSPRKRALLFKRLVAGSALRVGSNGRVTQTKKATYRWWDRGGRRGDRYWVRDVDLAGRQKWHGPFVVRGRTVRRVRSSPLLPRGGKRKVTAPPQSNLALGAPVPIAPIAPGIAPDTPPDQVTQILASRQTVRLGVDREGWVRVPLAVIENRGVDVRRPELLHVFTAGVEVAANVRDGALEFFGQPIDTLDTAVRAYVVEAQASAGLRIDHRGRAAAPAGPTTYVHAARREDRKIYLGSLRNGERRNFYGDVVSNAAASELVSASRLASTDGAEVEVRLQGLTSGAHRVTVEINGDPVGDMTFEGDDNTSKTFPGRSLRAGQNTVRLQGAGSNDFSLVDSIELRYPRELVADDDRLTPTVPAGRRVALGGFVAGGVRTIDVTNPARPVELATDASADVVNVTTSGDGTRRLHAFASNRSIEPVEAVTGHPSSLRAAGNAGELVILTRGDLAPELAPLVARRRAEGLSVAVIDLQDIYDEFGVSQVDHRAIRSFLDFARTSWAVPPSYVLLAGDGTFDPRGYLGSSTGNVVPTRLIDTAARETASDSELTGTLATGRLPARNAEQLRAFVAKTLRWQDAPSPRSALFVSDVNDTWDFSASSDALVPRLPATWAPTKIERGKTPNAKDALLGALNAGPAVVNYAGHGSLDLWRGDLLTNADARALGNADHPSFYVMMTCLNAFFQDPFADSLAESLLAAPGGAAAVFSSTGTTVPGPQERANQQLFASLFQSEVVPRLGDAITTSLNVALDDDVRRTWVLLGDPSARVPR